MELVAISNGEDWCKVFGRDRLHVTTHLPTQTGTLSTDYADFMVPAQCTLVVIDPSTGDYRAFFGVKIGMPYPHDAPGPDGEVWFDHVMSFDDQQFGSDTDELPGLTEAIDEYFGSKH